MAENSGEGLIPPPHFQRMLSWRLSQVVDYSQTATTARKEKKKKRKESKDKGQRKFLPDPTMLDTDSAAVSPPDKQPKEGYIVTNSDGEEEVYYSAPETPGVSESDENEDDMLSLSTRSLEASEVVELEKNLHQTKSSTKRSKKRRREMAKVACVDFFEPLCNLFEEKISLNVEEMELSNFSTVPSLCEICLRTIRKITIEAQEDSHLPFLITSLVSNDRRLSGTVSSHVQWIEKLLGEVERFELYTSKVQAKKQQGGAKKDPPPAEEKPFAYGLQEMFPHDFSPIRRSDINHGQGYHACLPSVLYRTRRGMTDQDCYLLRPLLHYTNYFYPLMVDSKIEGNVRIGESSQIGQNSLTVAQTIAIGRVNYWINTRYPLLSKMYSESLKLWPGYVHWARGNLQLAVEAFARALEELNDPIDQAVLLNEMGRMFLYFNEQKLAVSHHSKSLNVDTSSSDSCRLTDVAIPMLKSLVLPCNLALQASAWDTGALNRTSAVMARKSWDSVLKECRETTDYPTNVWYLHAAAVESKLFVHAGQPVEIRTPDHQERTALTSSNRGGVSSDVVLKWANECEELISSHSNLSKFPILYYHLSVVQAIKGEKLKSQRTFDAFINDFAGFGEWENGFPGYQFYQHLSRPQRPHPWKNLFDLVSPNASSSDLPHVVPIMPLLWRVRLLHPLHPYASNTEEGSTVADHSPCTRGLSLRLTNDGYLTGDLQMDLPPLKTVLIDPYTGELCFPRATSLKHYCYNREQWLQQRNVDSTLPWPLRVYESPDCVVELVMADKPDKEYHSYTRSPVSNYMCMLHWYGSDGTHHKIDLRKVIRRERRNVLLNVMNYRTDITRITPEEAEERVDYMFDNGLEMSTSVLYSQDGPKEKNARRTSSSTTRKDHQFMLFLHSHMVLGPATVRLAFMLQSELEAIEAIVFVNCESSKDFLNPHVHVAPDKDGFSFLWPSPDLTKPYSLSHMEHVKFSTVVQVKKKKQSSLYEYSKLVFDNKGDMFNCSRVQGTDLSNKRPSQLTDLLSGIHCLGERCYQLDHEGHCVTSWSIKNPKLTHQSSRMQDPASLLSAPGLLLVVCRDGVVVLHPGTLERLNIAGAESTDPPPPQDGIAHPQFNAVEAVVDIIAVHDVKKVEEAAKVEDNNLEEELVQSAMLASLDPGTNQSKVAGGGQDEPGNNKDNNEEKERPEWEEDFLVPDDVGDYGSGCTVLAINDRLLILECSPRTASIQVMIDIKLPGKPLDFHVMKGLGFIVTASQFPDVLRSDLYWISPKGKLLGMLPCLGINPHSLFSAFLPPRSKPLPSSGKQSTEQDDGGMHLFFSDGVGGICCLRLKDVLN